MNAPLESGVTDRNAALSGADLRAARAIAAAQKRRVLDVLEEQCGRDPEQLVTDLARLLHYETLSMQDLNRLEPAFDVLPFPDCLTHDCIVLHDAPGLLLAFSDPFDEHLRSWCDVHLPPINHWKLAQSADISAYLARHEDSMRALDSLAPGDLASSRETDGIEDLSIRSISEDTSPVVRLVHSTLYDALKSGVSDIHIESLAQGLAIKYRIDGTLAHINSVEGVEMAEQVLSRIKVMSELDISERRVPQDGRFRVRALGRDIDFRVSIMPCIHGEDAVLRILDKQGLADELTGLRLDVLGFEPDVLAAFRKLSQEPYGLLLVTGPTGSGKTTSLYAAISEINNGHDKIITIEDPVEYQLAGVLQIPVNEKKGLTFARGLRSILRHDPDRIMVGEIRDPDTAQIAVQAALTGHLVFSTVHANNVFDVLGRFTHMNVDPYSFVSALNAILAQRLVRINCPACAERTAVSDEQLHESGIDPLRAKNASFMAGKGCGKCRGSGFKGRRAVGELLILTDELRELIVSREPIRKVKEAARRGGTRLLRDGAIDLMLRGQTTLAEINRVTLAS
jgi:general secretion pathway protein E